MAVFDLEAVIKLTDQGFKQGLSKAGKAIATFGKVAGVAIGAGVAGVTALTTATVNAYADYEQLSGGVQKLFGNAGKDLKAYAAQTGQTMSEARSAWQKLEYAQNKVIQNAEQAYRTTGMSANEYIENVTGISAALISSYGGDTIKAAQQADKAMRAISDNFNTFGGDIESVKAAYQGFAKQNYTMLDNLKLGYGGTKTEMERLIKDANEYRKELGLTGDLTIDKYGDIVEAIDLIQQKQGIAGTTAKEAATTISGSLNMTKAAWKNLVRAFGDKDADLSQYFNALVTSAETAFKNILPVAEQALEGIGQVISDIVPIVGEKIPDMVTKVLPGIIKAGTSLVTSLMAGFATALPMLVSSLPGILGAIKDGFVQAWPQLKQAGKQLMEMAGEGIKNAGKKLKDKVGPAFTNMWDSIKKTAEAKLPGITSLVSQTWDMISSGAKTAWSGITTVLGEAWDIIGEVFGTKGGDLQQGMSNIWSGIQQRWQGALDGLTSFWNTWGDTITTAASGIWETLKVNFQAGLTIISDIFSVFASAFAGDWAGAWEGIKTLGQDWWDGITNVLSTAWEGIKATAAAAWEAIGPAITEKWDAVTGAVSGAWEAIKGGVSGAWEGIKGAVSKAWENVKNGTAWNTIKSKADEAWVAFKGTISSNWGEITGKVSEAWDKVKDSPAWASISENATEAWSAFEGTVSSGWATIVSAVSSAWEDVKSGTAWTSISEKASEAWTAFEGTIAGAFVSVKEAIDEAWETVTSALNFQLPDFILGNLPRLPKISISGSFSLSPLSVPTISWNAKAMHNPYMFTDMTLFGAGEAGDEVLYGRSALITDIRGGIASETDGFVERLTDILEELRTYLPELANRPTVLDSGALVGGIGYEMDRQLGDFTEMGGRGLSFA